jgi:hypothetical protein
MARRTTKALFSSVIALAIIVYVGSYIARTMNGRYEPGIIGLNGVKVYFWAPYGFVDGFEWNGKLRTIYYPLYALDFRFWHTPDKAYGDIYPIHIPDNI